eukprot:TRINITY_DN1877_c0_g1_i1.p1 TRINITY_DN1877_c0_g1~~TRINITY_DN1877_c0_g1_i1.p1  ORF type:complete len:199 (-),score=48.99 TRINITY_DN1877_c0_g1_i1:139-735(-)
MCIRDRYMGKKTKIFPVLMNFQRLQKLKTVDYKQFLRTRAFTKNVIALENDYKTSSELQEGAVKKFLDALYAHSSKRVVLWDTEYKKPAYESALRFTRLRGRYFLPEGGWSEEDIMHSLMSCLPKFYQEVNEFQEKTLKAIYKEMRKKGKEGVFWKQTKEGTKQMTEQEVEEMIEKITMLSEEKFYAEYANTGRVFQK